MNNKCLNNFSFTVIIPLYNKRPHVRRSVESVLNQTFQNFELLVVDDGSTDGGLEELECISDSRFKILKKSNGGVSSARNFGINNSRNQYIAFLDADDEWSKFFLETIYKMIQLYPNQAIYTTGCNIVGGLKPRIKSVGKESGFFLVDDYFQLFVNLKGSINNSSTSVVNKEMLLKVGLFPEEQVKHEDWTVWFQLSLISNVVYTNDIYSTIYLEAVNRSNVYVDPKLLLKNCNMLIDKVEKFIITNELINNKINRKSINLVYRRILQGVINSAVKVGDISFPYLIEKDDSYKRLGKIQKIMCSPIVFRSGLFIYNFYSVFFRRGGIVTCNPPVIPPSNKRV